MHLVSGDCKRSNRCEDLCLQERHFSPCELWERLTFFLCMFTWSFWKSLWGFCTWQEFLKGNRWGIWGWNWFVHQEWKKIPVPSYAVWINICIHYPVTLKLRPEALWVTEVNCEIPRASLYFYYIFLPLYLSLWSLNSHGFDSFIFLCLNLDFALHEASCVNFA